MKTSRVLIHVACLLLAFPLGLRAEDEDREKLKALSETFPELLGLGEKVLSDGVICAGPGSTGEIRWGYLTAPKPLTVRWTGEGSAEEARRFYSEHKRTLYPGEDLASALEKINASGLKEIPETSDLYYKFYKGEGPRFYQLDDKQSLVISFIEYRGRIAVDSLITGEKKNFDFKMQERFLLPERAVAPQGGQDDEPKPKPLNDAFPGLLDIREKADDPPLLSDGVICASTGTTTGLRWGYLTTPKPLSVRWTGEGSADEARRFYNEHKRTIHEGEAFASVLEKIKARGIKDVSDTCSLELQIGRVFKWKKLNVYQLDDKMSLVIVFIEYDGRIVADSIETFERDERGMKINSKDHDKFPLPELVEKP